MKYEIKIATVDDSEGIYELLRSAWEHDYQDVLSAHHIQLFLRSWSAEQWKAKISDPHSIVLVAYNNSSDLIGFTSGEISKSARSAVLSALYIAPGLQGKGLGFQLFREISRIFLEREITSLSLRTFAARIKTRDFYMKVGGRESESAPYILEGCNIPGVSYQWDF